MGLIQQPLPLNFHFTFTDGHTVRVVEVDGEPWFVATDVCKALDLGNSRQAVARLAKDEKGVITTDTPGGKQRVSVVNEPGLYALINRSRKPEAQAFQRWVNHDVLPSIRKTGQYTAVKSFQDTKKYKQLRQSGYDHDDALAWGDIDAAAIEIRKQVTAEWVRRGGNIAHLTNFGTRIVTGKTATQLKGELRIKESPRRYMSALEKAALSIVEGLGKALHTQRDSHGTGALERDLGDASRFIDWEELRYQLPDAPVRPPLPKPSQRQLPDPKRDIWDDEDWIDRSSRQEL